MPIPAPSSHRPLRALRALAADSSGAVTVTLALTFTALVGFAALGTEVAEWYSIRRTMQGAADSAAYSAALAKWNGASTTAYTSEATSVTASYGFVDGTNDAVVTINSPPASGSYTADSNAVEVIVSRPQPLQLARIFLAGSPTLTARAVASLNGSACVLALDRSDITDVADNGNTTLNLNSCSLYVNSPSDSALTLVGQATINADAAYISGNYTTSGQASLNTTNGTVTGALPANDPYADVSIPSYSGCDQTNYSVSGRNNPQTLTPGPSGIMVLCNGLSVTGNGSLTMSPGTYIINGGSVSVAGGSTINAPSGVTVILTSSSGSNYATASIAGGADVTINAPTSGPLAGLAIFQDRNAPQTASPPPNSFTGGTTQNITGAIYFPNQGMTFNGGTNTGGARCTQLVGLTITFNGNAAFNNDCKGVGVRSVGTSFIRLVE
jgi:Flp pilus assembly protein TadG